MTPTSFALRSLMAALAGFAMGCTSDPLGLATPTSATPSAAVALASAATTCTTGDGVNDACSCDADAQTYCSGFYASDWQSYARANGYTTASWKYGLLDCLDRQPVSSACSASLARREALNAHMMASCQSYCRGTTPQPGAEPCVDKLKSIYASLDNACRLALDAHEAAKAIKGRSPF